MEGKQIILFYDDGDAISRKDGILLKEENNWIHLQVADGKILLINRERIVRMEMRE